MSGCPYNTVRVWFNGFWDWAFSYCPKVKKEVEATLETTRGVAIDLFPGMGMYDCSGKDRTFLSCEGSIGNFITDIFVCCLGGAGIYQLFLGNLFTGSLLIIAGGIIYLNSRRTDDLLIAIREIERNADRSITQTRLLFDALSLQISKQGESQDGRSRSQLEALAGVRALSEQVPVILGKFLRSLKSIVKDHESVMGERFRSLSAASERLGVIQERTKEATKHLNRLGRMIEELDEKITSLGDTDESLRSTAKEFKAVLADIRRSSEEARGRHSHLRHRSTR